MIKRLAWILTGLMLCIPSASAGLDVSWTEGEAWFPDQKDWVYHYTYTFPELAGDEILSEELNHYFDTAIGEMVKLVLPMFSVDMPGEGANRISDRYEITCNNDEFFSFLLHRSQSAADHEVYSLQSAVFAVSGPYKGDSLTLRGLAREIGESSSQISEHVLPDIWRRIEERMRAGDPDIPKDMSLELLSADFFPETHFYADRDGNVSFYLQPGLLGDGTDIPVFTYTSQELETLLNPR